MKETANVEQVSTSVGSFLASFEMKINRLLELLIAIVGGAIILLSTPHGIGTSPDSVTYLAAANNLLSGRGITTSNTPGVFTPLTQYPPFFSIALATTGLISGSPYQSARILAALVFAGNIFLVGFILSKTIPGSRWPAIVGSILMLISPVMLGIHVMAWSEPLFILLSLLSILALSETVQRRSLVWLVLASILTALAFLTRYAGVSLIVTGILGIVFLYRNSILRRIADACIYAVVSVGPSLVVLLYNQSVTGSATNRTLSYHPVSISVLQQGMKTINAWFGLPEQLSGWMHLLFAGGVGIVLIGLVLASLRLPNVDHDSASSVKQPFHPSIVMMFLFICVYLAFLLISISFIDANTPLDNRILSPIFPFLMVVIIYIISRAFQFQKALLRHYVPAALLVLFVLIYSMSSIPFLLSARENGLGYSTPKWRSSELIGQIRAIQPEIAIYSNIPEAIYLHTEHPSARLPRVYELSAQQSNPDFSEEMSDLGEWMANGQAVIIYFNQPGRTSNPSLEDIQNILQLEPLVQVADGEIFTVAAPSGQ